MSLTLVVMAAGVGSRYGGLKQLESVGPGGETLLEYSIFDSLRAGFRKIVLVIRPETEKAFRKDLGSRVGDRAPLAYVHQRLSDLPGGRTLPPERQRPWGTGQAVLAAEGEVSEPFAVINADDFYGAQSFAVVAHHLREQEESAPPSFALAGFQVGPTLSDRGPVSRGVCRSDDEGWLEQIVEVLKIWKQGHGGRFVDESGQERVLPPETLVSMNLWGFTPALFPALTQEFEIFLDNLSSPNQEFLLPTVVQSMIEEGKARVRVLPHASRWCGITFPEDKERVRLFLADLVSDGQYPPRLWA
jgi:NDP-sugar pyrophosphorylase family protein